MKDSKIRLATSLKYLAPFVTAALLGLCPARAVAQEGEVVVVAGGDIAQFHEGLSAYNQPVARTGRLVKRMLLESRREQKQFAILTLGDNFYPNKKVLLDRETGGGPLKLTRVQALGLYVGTWGGITWGCNSLLARGCTCMSFGTCVDGGMLRYTYFGIGNNDIDEEYQADARQPGTSLQWFSGQFDGSRPALKAAGRLRAGSYEFSLGSWSIIALDSNCSDGHARCQADQPRVIEEWAHRNKGKCKLAMMHVPPFYLRGTRDDDPQTYGRNAPGYNAADSWNALVKGGVDVVLTGHEHEYMRFEPAGEISGTTWPKPETHGPLLFIVGTAGADLNTPARTKHAPPAVTALVALRTGRYGVLKMRLKTGAFRYEFLAVDQAAPVDIGGRLCRRQ
jgi:hypothetical protein